MPTDLPAQLVDARDFLKKEFGCRAIEIFRDPLFDFLSGLLGSALEKLGLSGGTTQQEAEKRRAPHVDFPDDGYSANRNMEEVIGLYFKKIASFLDDGQLASEILFASSEKLHHASSKLHDCSVSVLVLAANPPICKRKYKGFPYLSVHFSIPTRIPDFRSKETFLPMYCYRFFFPLPPPEKVASALDCLVREMDSIFRPFFSERERLLLLVKEISLEYAKKLKIIEIEDAGIRAVAKKIASDFGKKCRVECGIDEFRVCSLLDSGKLAVALVPRGFSDFVLFSEKFNEFILTGKSGLDGGEFGIVEKEGEL